MRIMCQNAQFVEKNMTKSLVVAGNILNTHSPPNPLNAKKHRGNNFINTTTYCRSLFFNQGAAFLLPKASGKHTSSPPNPAPRTPHPIPH